MHFGLIGYPLSHSFSQEYFNQKFKLLGLPYRYSLFPIEKIEEFENISKQHFDLKGLNVTLPYKQSILKYVDIVSKEVSEIGATNTLKKLPNGKWKAFNTDVTGFVQAIEKATDRKTFDRAIIIGNGGASKAVYYALQHHFSCSNIIVACRSPIKSHELFIHELSEDIVSAADILVQCTPVGMYPNVDDMLLLPYYALHSGQVVMDLVYNPEQTHFVRYARNQGCTVASGLQMLYAQADAAFEIWTQDKYDL
ncbi:MAG: shikimate dehydrogenase [Bacteroidia bacterium]|nr:shikimate dehydrogenase [Bacteroidia bacterium]MDW8303123.1 shikimate dehydrogenase [Bacteroidia bacterium]